MSPSRRRILVPILLLLGLCVAFMPGVQQRAHAANAYLQVQNGTCSSTTMCSVTVSPGSGSAITIIGIGFDPSTSVAVASNTPNPGVNVTSSSGGSITAYFPVNTMPSGTYQFSGIEGSNNAQLTVNVTVTGTGSTVGCGTLVGSLTLTPNTVAPGGTFTLTGSGFSPNVTVTSNLGIQPPTTPSGTFSVNYTVPTTVTPGTYTVTACDSAHTSAATLVVSGTAVGGTASLGVSPGIVTVGQSVTVNGSGFNTSGTVTISGSGIPISTASLTSSGTFSTTVPTLVNTATGTYTLSATDGVHTGTFSEQFTNPYSQAITATPNTVAAGSVLQVNGSGFIGNPAVQVILSGTGFATQFVSQSSAGVFTASVPITAGTPNGLYTMTATDGTRTATTQYTVGATTTAGVTLSAVPSNATAGQPITVNGAGFTPNVGVTITGAGSSAATTVNASGAFSVSFTVPAGTAAGSYALTATDTTARTATYTIRVGATGITITPNASSGTPGQVVPFTLNGFTPGEQIVVSLASTATPATAIAGTSQTVTAGANGSITGSLTIPAIAAGTYSFFGIGQTSMTVAYSTFSVLAITPTAVPTAIPTVVPPTPTPIALPAVSSGPATTTFAEGNTGSTANGGALTFSEKLYLFNPGTASSTVNITYYVYATGQITATTVTANETVAPGSTVVRSVNNDAGNDKFVSIVVQANPGIVAETAISRVNAAGAQLDSDSSTGSTSLQQNWYMAEGYTGASIQEYITLFNPGNTAASTQVSYLPSDGQAPAPQAVNVPAQGRVTINVRSVYNNLVKKGSRNVAISVSSSVPIAVDRSIYWGNGSGSAKYGYSLGPAIAAGKTSQSFAFLPTESGSQSFVTILNPGTGTASATLTLRALGAITLGTFSASIPAGQRYTFTVPNLLHGDQGAIVGQLTSSLPVVAETSLYFNGSPNIGNHPGLVIQGTTGSSQGSRATVSASGAQLRLFNPGTSQERVQVKLGTASGSSVVYDSSLPAGLARSIVLPPGTDPRGVSVVASGTIEAVLINGGDGAPLASGGTLN